MEKNSISWKSASSTWRESLESKTCIYLSYLLLAMAVALAPPLMAQQQEFTVASNHAPITIPDDDANFAIESNIAVSADVTISDVNVMVDIDHQKIGDLEIDLFSPAGERVRLVNEVCDDRDDFDSTVFDDEAPLEIGEVCPPGAGPYRPDDDLDEFDGEFAFGVWTLVVEDVHDDEIGALIGWSLTIEGDFVGGPSFSSASVVSAASFQGGAVAVGEMATIFGRALGPAVGVVAQLDPGTGALPTELSGVQVFFDEQPAPLFYVSSSQFNVQVPFDVTPGQAVRVRVDYEESGTLSNTIPVISSGPAVFTQSGRGQGLAVARNANGSVNDQLNPATPGTALTLYATGLGAVEPGLESGRPAPADPLSRVVENVRVAIGGVEAEVLFAGLAPNFVGLYQIDVIIPETVESGQIVSVGLEVADRGLENFVWISIE